MSLRTLAVAIFLSLVLASASIGHPGGLDSNGGHVNRKTGEYHNHDGEDTGSVKPFALGSGTSNAFFRKRLEPSGASTNISAEVTKMSVLSPAA